MISLQRADKKTAYGNSHLAKMLHRPRTYLCINLINIKNKLRREGDMKKNNTGTTIRKPGGGSYARTYNLAWRKRIHNRRSCCVLRLSVSSVD